MASGRHLRAVGKKNRPAYHAGVVNCGCVHLFVWTLCLCLLCGCGTRIGTRNIGFDQAHIKISKNALNSRSISTLSMQVLSRYNLASQYRTDPKGVVAILEKKTLSDKRRDLLFVLAELSYDAAGKPARDRAIGFTRESRIYYLNAALFAYFFLFEPHMDEPPNTWDRTFRWACNIYNTSLAKAMQGEDGQLSIRKGPRNLPSGSMDLSINKGGFPWDLNSENSFVIPSDQLDVFGLDHRNRESGIGVPFLVATPQEKMQTLKRSLPGILLMRIEGGLAGFHKGRLKGELALYTPLDAPQVKIEGVKVPLEIDLSVHLAHTLNQAQLWHVGKREFFTGKNRYRTGLYEILPHRKGTIPVVFVHGTFSNPLAWAEMCNALVADPVIRKRFIFWFYLYDSNRLINLSALDFRAALQAKVAEIDPENKDPSLRNMVVIGHSQGGLLTKLTATDTGEQILREVLGKGLNELELSDEQYRLMRKTGVFKPLPFVKRVVFISTPHRGSKLVTDWGRSIVRKVVSVSAETLKIISDVMASIPEEDLPEELRSQKLRTSIDSMDPDNKALIALSKLPVSPTIRSHSIMGVLGDGDPYQSSDGVVEYKSAHLEGVNSEYLIQPGGHSIQRHPLAIEEVRRILHLHLRDDVTPQ